MNQTVVYIMLANADARYVFPENKELFLKIWDNNIVGCGFFTGVDVNGDTIIISPNQCSTIKIAENDGRI